MPMVGPSLPVPAGAPLAPPLKAPVPGEVGLEPLLEPLDGAGGHPAADRDASFPALPPVFALPDPA